MLTIPRKTLKKHLPAVLLQYRRRIQGLSVIRKRNAHDPRLPEVQHAKAVAAHNATLQQAIATKLAADARKAALLAAKLELEASIAATPPVPAAEAA